MYVVGRDSLARKTLARNLKPQDGFRGLTILIRKWRRLDDK